MTLTFPGQSPTVSGNIATVDMLVNNPRLVTRTIADLTLQKFMVDLIFAPAGGVQGGAMLYQQATENDLYADDDVQEMAAGTEHPEIRFGDGEILTAQVQKFGGKFKVTEEARTRNQIGQVNRAMVRLANTIRRKTQQRALAELDAAISAHSRTTAGISWADAGGLIMGTDYANNALPGADLAAASREASENELGYEYNMLIVNPQEWEALLVAYGPDKLPDVLRGYGIETWWVTNQQTAGTAKLLAKGQVGELGFEKPLTTKTWWDEDLEVDFVKSNVRPIVYVTDPFAILELTGLAA